MLRMNSKRSVELIVLGFVYFVKISKRSSKQYFIIYFFFNCITVRDHSLTQSHMHASSAYSIFRVHLDIILMYIAVSTRNRKSSTTLHWKWLHWYFAVEHNNNSVTEKRVKLKQMLNNCCNLSKWCLFKP